MEAKQDVSRASLSKQSSVCDSEVHHLWISCTEVQTCLIAICELGESSDLFFSME